MNTFKNIALVATTALSLVSASAFASEGSTKFEAPSKEVATSSNSGLYAVVGAGVNFNKNKLSSNNSTLNSKGSKNSLRFLVGAGNKFNENVRADVTLSFGPSSKFQMKNAGNKVGNLKVTTTAVMANGYYHFTGLSSTISPYATAGLGFAFNNVKGNVSDTSIKARKVNLAYQVGAGVSTAVANNIDLDLGYRFINNGKIKFKNVANTQKATEKLHAHSVMASVRVGL